MKFFLKALLNYFLNFEQKILREVVGSQDQIAASYGGFNKIIFKPDGSFIVNPIKVNKKTIVNLNKNLLLIYTGLPRTAHNIAKTYVEKLKNNKKKNILKILNLVDLAEKALKNDDLNLFAELLHESWLEKKSLGTLISNSKINDIYNHAIKKGALGGKLLGAGGGGFFIFFVPQEKQKNFINSFKNLIHIPFNFSYEGSKLILK